MQCWKRSKILQALTSTLEPRAKGEPFLRGPRPTFEDPTVIDRAAPPAHPNAHCRSTCRNVTFCHETKPTSLRTENIVRQTIIAMPLPRARRRHSLQDIRTPGTRTTEHVDGIASPPPQILDMRQRNTSRAHTCQPSIHCTLPQTNQTTVRNRNIVRQTIKPMPLFGVSRRLCCRLPHTTGIRTYVRVDGIATPSSQILICSNETPAAHSANEIKDTPSPPAEHARKHRTCHVRSSNAQLFSVVG